MVFNSIDFVLFFLIVFSLHFVAGRLNVVAQNVVLLSASIFFYCWWDIRFFILLFILMLISYFLGIRIEKGNFHRKGNKWLATGVVIILGNLLYFKYYDFFLSEFFSAFNILGSSPSYHSTNYIIPLGISFYTFRILGYLFDVKNGKTSAVKDPLLFANYILFFPVLICGPIERVNDFIPQLKERRNVQFSELRIALRQILWGLMKKLVIANGLSEITASTFDQSGWVQGSLLFVGMIAFAIEVYVDFSGYSDMAVGISLLLGFRVTQNFKFPYFAENIVEYWRRWHISLTSWLTEFVYTPISLVLRDWGKWGIISAITLNMVICGFWHGANWTFIVFGLLHGCYFIPIIFFPLSKKKKKKAKASKNILSNLKLAARICSTFLLVAFTDILFRSQNLKSALLYYHGLFSTSLFSMPILSNRQMISILLTSLFLFIEWNGRNQNFAIENIFANKPSITRWLFYSFIIFLIGMYMDTSESPFIYQQF